MINITHKIYHHIFYQATSSVNIEMNNSLRYSIIYDKTTRTDSMTHVRSAAEQKLSVLPHREETTS
jgi:hypothetical protein